MSSNTVKSTSSTASAASAPAKSCSVAARATTPTPTTLNPLHYNFVMKKLRSFFNDRGFVESEVNCRFDVLAACEDPETVANFPYYGQQWPLPQTGQMRLEDDLLANPQLGKLYCVTNSFRQEPCPVEGRHQSAFPLPEFEMPGTIHDLIEIESQILSELGFTPKLKHVKKAGSCGAASSFTKAEFPVFRYNDLAKYYDAPNGELTNEHELRMERDFGPVVFVTHFPKSTHPFFNMKRDPTDPNLFLKVDVIVGGHETFGSAERECSVEQMKAAFANSTGGAYSKLLYDKFGKERVDSELERYFQYQFFPRCGAGIGLTRLVNAMHKYGLFPRAVFLQVSIENTIMYKKTRVILSLDVNTVDEAKYRIATLEPYVVGYKLHPEIIKGFDAEFADWLREFALRRGVFFIADMKYCDIAEIIKRQYLSAHFNLWVWAHAVTVMSTVTPQAVDVLYKASKGRDLFGLLIVTHMSTGKKISDAQHTSALQEIVEHKACIGLVSQSTYRFSNRLYFVPGIRYIKQEEIPFFCDQKYRNPEQVKNYADLMIVGRGILKDGEDPIEMAKLYAKASCPVATKRAPVPQAHHALQSLL